MATLKKPMDMSDDEFIKSLNITPDDISTAMLKKDASVLQGVWVNPDLCPKCGRPWEEHDFGVPEPDCPHSDKGMLKRKGFDRSTYVEEIFRANKLI